MLAPRAFRSRLLKAHPRNDAVTMGLLVTERKERPPPAIEPLRKRLTRKMGGGALCGLGTVGRGTDSGLVSGNDWSIDTEVERGLGFVSGVMEDAQFIGRRCRHVGPLKLLEMPLW